MSIKGFLLLDAPCALFAVILALVVSGSNGFYIDERQSPRAQHWAYNEQYTWPQKYHECGAAKQSPIDIQHSHVIYNKGLKLVFYNYNKAIKFKIQNAHHTIKMNPQFHDDDQNLNEMMTADEQADIEQGGISHPSPQFGRNANQQSHFQESRLPNTSGDASSRLPSSSNDSNKEYYSKNGKQRAAFDQNNNSNNNQLPYNGVPTIKLDWLDSGNNEFSLHDIHFHWAERKDNGSEHAIDGRRASMEMHLVHIKRGLEQSKISFTSDSIAVIGILIESYKKSNADFNPIANVLPRLNGTEHSLEIEFQSLNDLLPAASLKKFYSYSGSLTTPPCLEVVNWIVMRERLNLNAKQMEMFRNLYAPSSANGNPHGSFSSHFGGELLMPNVRNLRPLNNRIVHSSFSPGGRGGSEIVNEPDEVSVASRLLPALHIAQLILAMLLLLV